LYNRIFHFNISHVKFMFLNSGVNSVELKKKKMDTTKRQKIEKPIKRLASPHGLPFSSATSDGK
jgi:hypothetical protein